MSLSKVMKLANTYATPTGHLDFHFVPLAVSYDLQWLHKLRTFPTVKQKTFLLIKPNSTLQFSSKKFCMSYFGKRAAKEPLCSLNI